MKEAKLFDFRQEIIIQNLAASFNLKLEDFGEVSSFGYRYDLSKKESKIAGCKVRTVILKIWPWTWEKHHVFMGFIHLQAMIKSKFKNESHTL